MCDTPPRLSHLPRHRVANGSRAARPSVAADGFAPAIERAWARMQDTLRFFPPHVGFPLMPPPTFGVAGAIDDGRQRYRTIRGPILAIFQAPMDVAGIGVDSPATRRWLNKRRPSRDEWRAAFPTPPSYSCETRRISYSTRTRRKYSPRCGSSSTRCRRRDDCETMRRRRRIAMLSARVFTTQP